MTDNIPAGEILIEDGPVDLEPASETSAPMKNGATGDEPSLDLYINALATAEAVATRAANGDLEARITNTEEFGELAPSSSPSTSCSTRPTPMSANPRPRSNLPARASSTVLSWSAACAVISAAAPWPSTRPARR